ncbi:MAG TPA: hypothetical protein VL563_15865 [Gemmatimonadales bacterium]|jgi:hypothetical protein|nr:hypothetical protein [Gemmatimonadales bacterium]
MTEAQRREALQPVLEAAAAWDAARHGTPDEALEVLTRLLDAIRAYRAAKEERRWDAHSSPSS